MEPRNRPRPAWLDTHPNEWPDAARRFYNLCATAAERKLNRDRDKRNDDVSASGHVDAT